MYQVSDLLCERERERREREERERERERERETLDEMGISSSNSKSLFFLLLLSLFINLPPPASTVDLYSLIYKGCANKNFDTTASEQTLSALSSALLAQSSTSKFFKTTASSSAQPIFGLFQCRGDLSNTDCASCVQHLLPMWSSLCGATAIAARVQLTACYALYQVSGFPQAPGTQMLFKRCGSGGSGGSGDGFEEKRDTAFANLQSGLTNGSFYATSYQSVYAMAQCEGDLSTSDCRDCVSQAVQKSEVECGGAGSGQIYLDKCYITYNYYPNGVPRDADDVSDSGLGGGQIGKTVAIVVGGAAGLMFLIICLLFVKNLMKKKDDY